MKAPEVRRMELALVRTAGITIPRPQPRFTPSDLLDEFRTIQCARYAQGPAPRTALICLLQTAQLWMQPSSAALRVTGLLQDTLVTHDSNELSCRDRDSAPHTGANWGHSSYSPKSRSRSSMTALSARISMRQPVSRAASRAF